MTHYHPHKSPRPHAAKRHRGLPQLRHAVIPVVWLLACVLVTIFVWGPAAVLDAGKYVMLSSAIIAIIIARGLYKRSWKAVAYGMSRSWRQLFPAMIVLLFIAMVSTTWMLSGVVPTLIDYGLRVLNPRFFLLLAAVICSVVSVFTGSSWTTIATIGVALQGIGTVFGYSDGWIAGAIISGAYFGDKVSPLSDTTVLASSACDVPLVTHVRYMLYSTLPSILVALCVYTVAGLLFSAGGETQSHDIIHALHATFLITPWALLIPFATGVLIAMRMNTYLTLGLSTLMGVAGMVVWQPDVVAQIAAVDGQGLSFGVVAATIVRVLCCGAGLHTGSDMLDTLSTTGGIAGMWSTLSLVFCAMIFGGVMIGTGMLSAITDAITSHLRGVKRVVTATVGTGIFLNACTADQYLSIILGGNVYKNLYRRQRLEARLLSRTIEDSTSVTSVIIPWNSCSMTQAAVLGVPSLTFIPYCVFNYVSPLMSLILAYTGITIRRVGRKKL